MTHPGKRAKITDENRREIFNLALEKDNRNGGINELI